MRISKKHIVILLFLMLCCNKGLLANTDESLLIPVQESQELKTKPSPSIFNLVNIVDSFLNNDKSQATDIIDKKAKIRKEFILTTSKFDQGNASISYDEYDKLIDKIDNDTLLLSLSKIFYEIGFFSLANKSINSITFENQFYDNILDLEKSYKVKADLTKEQEIYFAKIYSNIYTDNLAQESITELLKNKNLYSKNDYYYFMLSRANFEIKKYQDAVNYINKAISINPNNINYQAFKVDILLANKKYVEAEKIIKKAKKKSILFADTFAVKEEVALISLTKNDKERKYHIANKSFLEGNYVKTKNDCQSVLNFDKNNYKILTLQAKSELALGNIERANIGFVNSYKENKKNPETLIGLGDIKYIHGDYKNAVKSYKKAYKNDKNNYEVVIKLLSAQREYAKNTKEIKKLETKLDKIPKNDYLSYYKSAISIAQKNPVLKEEFLKRSLAINPMYEDALGELVSLHLKNKNYELAKALIYNVSLTLKKNYYYYYLCGLYNQSINKKQEAIQFYKTSLKLNPNFEIANVKLLKLIPDTLNEEI